MITCWNHVEKPECRFIEIRHSRFQSFALIYWRCCLHLDRRLCHRHNPKVWLRNMCLSPCFHVILCQSRCLSRFLTMPPSSLVSCAVPSSTLNENQTFSGPNQVRSWMSLIMAMSKHRVPMLPRDKVPAQTRDRSRGTISTSHSENLSGTTVSRGPRSRWWKKWRKI